ncbi:MAG: hypothetical protein PVS2B2_26990 [Candidatus Acidiferrum sp.]
MWKQGGDVDHVKLSPARTAGGTLVGVRLLEGRIAALDAWITAQKETDLTRPGAIRRLVEIGLKAKK